MSTSSDQVVSLSDISDNDSPGQPLKDSRVRVVAVPRLGLAGLPVAAFVTTMTHLCLELGVGAEVLVGLSAGAGCFSFWRFPKHRLVAVGICSLMLISMMLWEWRVANDDAQRAFANLPRLKQPRATGEPWVSISWQGRVAQPPERPRAGELRLIVDGEAADRVHGKFQFTLPDLPWMHYAAVKQGDRLSGRARLRPTATPSADKLFQYERALARRGIVAYGRASDVLLLESVAASRSAKLRFVDQVLSLQGPSDESTLLLSLILGERFLVSDYVTRLFRETGTSHFLAVSGFHLAIVCTAAYALVWLAWRCFPQMILKVPLRQAQALVSFLAVLVYVSIVGWELTVVRSLVVVCIAVGGELLGRKPAPAGTMFFSFLIVELLWPGCFLEPSCQLTYAALIGLWVGSLRIPGAEGAAEGAELSPLRQWRKKIGRAAIATVHLNFAAWLCTAPVVVFWFRGLALSSVVVNITLITVFSLPVMVSGIVALGTAWLHLPGEGVFWYLASHGMRYLQRSLEVAREISDVLGVGYRELSDERALLLSSELLVLATLWVALTYVQGRYRTEAGAHEAPAKQ